MVFLLAKTRVESNVTLATVFGNFLDPNEGTVILGRPSHIEVFREGEAAFLTSIHIQPIFDRLIALSKLPGRPCAEEARLSRGLDMPVLLLESQWLAVLCFDADLHRFIPVFSVDLRALGLTESLHAPLLAVDEGSATIAVAARGGSIAVLRSRQESEVSLSGPLAHQCMVPDPSALPSPVIVEDICFVESESRDATRLVLLLRYKRRDGSIRQQLQVLRVDPECLSMVACNLLDSLLEEGAACRQLLPVPSEGILLLSSKSLRVLPIYETAGQYNSIAQCKVVTIFDHHIHQQLTDLQMKLEPGTRDVAGCWRSVNSAKGVMFVCLATHTLQIDLDMDFYTILSSVEVKIIAGTKQARSESRVSGPPIFLPSGAFLLRTAAQDVEIYVPASEARGTYRVSQRIGHAAPVKDAAMADLEGLSQAQVYAVSREERSEGAGALHVLHGGHVVDTLFKSSADYQGVTGLWSIPVAPSDVTSALVIISFASGSRAMTAGSTLSDVTESVGLEADSQTLAAGSIADLLAAQVTSKGVFLCSLQSLWSRAAKTGPSSRSSIPSVEDLRPRKRSTPSDEEVDASFTSSEESIHRLLHGDGAQSRADSDAEPLQAFSGLHLDTVPEVRDKGMVWSPPGGATMSCACVREGVVLLACPQLKSLMALALVQTVDNASPSTSGKRKRGVLRKHTIQAAQIGMPAELSCIHAIEAPEDTDCAGGLLCIVGTYEPAVELLLLDRQGGRDKGAWQFKRLCRLQNEAICPVLPSSGVTANVADLPESVLLLQGADQHLKMQALVGWRSGLITQLDLRQAASQDTDRAVDETAGLIDTSLSLLPQESRGELSSTSALERAESVWEMTIVCVRRFTALPTKLIPLPSGMQAPALAIGERVSLLDFSPCSGKLQLDLLALAGVSHATPLLDPSDSERRGSSLLKGMLLMADGDGSLRLLELKQNTAARAVTFPVDGMPRCIAVQEQSGTLAVIVERPLQTSSPPASFECPAAPYVSCLDLMDPISGLVDSTYKLARNERATCIAILGSSFASSWEGERERTYFAVGLEVLPARDQRLGPPICGRIMLLAAHSSSIEALASVGLPDPAHAMCHLRDRKIIASVGKRLASFVCRKETDTFRLEMHAWTPTREEIKSLSVSPGGVIAAGGITQSVTLYACGNEIGFQIICSDPYSRHTVSCLAGTSLPEAPGNPWNVQIASCLDADGGMYRLRYERDERGLERNMRMDTHFHCRGSGVRILQGGLRCMDAASAQTGAYAGAKGPWVVCTSEGAVVQLSEVSAVDYAVLAAVEAAMARRKMAGMISGASHSAFRSSVEASCGGNRALAHDVAAGSRRAVDGDLLGLLTQLPEPLVEQVLGSAVEEDVPQLHAGDIMETETAVRLTKSLRYVMDLLDRVLIDV